MCMPTNFSIRKKHSSSFQRTKKKKIQKDDFFCDCDEFLNDTKKNNKNENFSFKS